MRPIQRLVAPLLLLAGCPVDEPPSDPEDSPVLVDSPAETDAQVETDLPPVEEQPPVPTELGRGFVDISADWWQGRAAAMTTLPMSFSDVLFADLDGDGVPEVVFRGVAEVAGGEAWARVARYDRTTEALVEDAQLTAWLRGATPAPQAVMDLDGDGLLDVVLGSPDPAVYARASGGWVSSGIYPYADHAPTVTLVDVDRDGWMDLMGPARACLPGADAVLIRYATGPRSWEDGVLSPGHPVTVQPYFVGVLPLGDRPVAFALGRTCDVSAPDPGFYVQSGTDPLTGRPVFTAEDVLPADAHFRIDPTVAGGPITLYQPMGMAVGDPGVDGSFEVAISTVGDLLDVFSATASPPWIDRTLELGLEVPLLIGGAPARQKPWGSAWLDLDRDGSLDLIAAHGDDAAPVPAGTFHIGAWWDPAAWGAPFHEVLGLGSTFGAHGLSWTDLDGDGRPDAGFGGAGEVPRIYLNRIDGPRPGIGLYLVGSSSGAVPTGTVVEVVDDGEVVSRTMIGGTPSPGAPPGPWVFSTSGDDGEVEEVRIHWASGTEQVVSGLSAGASHRIEEPPLVSADPPTRRVVADGVATVALQITPRGLDGALDPAVAVTCAVVFGSASVVQTLTDSEGTRCVVQAPDSPGAAVVELTLDGHPSPLRPRLFFDAP